MNYSLDWNKLMEFEGKGEPKLTIPFSVDTAFLKQDFALDIVVWNLKAENLEETKKVVDYILANFDKLFETAWTAFYRYYSRHINCTVEEFFKLIIFEEPDYYSIRVELNSDYLMDNTARYHFVVHTATRLSDDNIRLYMRDNKCCACDTNNDGWAILQSANFEELYMPEMAETLRKMFEDVYKEMEEEKVLLAPSFSE